MNIRQAQESDLGCWVELRYALWPECEIESLREEAESNINSSDQVCY